MSGCTHRPLVSIVLTLSIAMPALAAAQERSAPPVGETLPTPTQSDKEVRGVVLREDGSPVTNATVHLIDSMNLEFPTDVAQMHRLDPSAVWNAAIIGPVTTNERGEFKFALGLAKRARGGSEHWSS